MAVQYSLEAESRAGLGKEKTAKLRQNGLIPAVIYGADKSPEHITLRLHDLEVLAKRVHGQTHLIDINIKQEQGPSKTEKIFLRQLQRDPVSDFIIHADLLRVDMQKPVAVEVPVVSAGVPNGVKLGGMLETLQRTIVIRCLPEHVPPYVIVDVSAIEINRSLRVSEVPWPAEFKIVSLPDTVLFTVLGKTEEEEVAAAPVAEEGAEAEEPEVIGRKKKEEEETEGGEGKEKK